jgi:hypothetical protein
VRQWSHSEIAIVRYLHSDRSPSQIAQHNLRGFGDRSLFSQRSITSTNFIAQSKGFRQSFAIFTVIDRFHRFHNTI